MLIYRINKCVFIMYKYVYLLYTYIQYLLYCMYVYMYFYFCILLFSNLAGFLMAAYRSVGEVLFIGAWTT